MVKKLKQAKKVAKKKILKKGKSPKRKKIATLVKLKLSKKVKKTSKKKANVLIKSKPKKKVIKTVFNKKISKPKKKVKKLFKKIKKVPNKIIAKKKSSKIKKKIELKKIVKKLTKSVRKKPKATKVIRVTSKPVKKTESATLESFLPNNLFKAKIKVIGIGGGGASIVSEIGKSLGKANFVIADTDSRFIKKNKGIKYVLFGQELTHGLGTGLNPELAKIAAENEKERIAELFENQDIVILVSSLGGGVGSGATKVFADISKKFDCITFGIFTLPFKFEGNNKHRIALRSLAELRSMLNVSITIPNERIFKVIDESTSITQAFSLINKNLIRSLESLIDLIYNPGVINIDFADLRAILQGKGNLAFLNTAEATGKDSSEKIMQEILNNPLYQNNNFTAEKILFNIAGGNTLSMMEVDKISRMISDQNQKAKIIFGISKSKDYKNKIKTTLLMTGAENGREAKLVEKKPVLEEKEVKSEIKKEKPKKFVRKKIISQKKKEKMPKAVEDDNTIALPENVIPVFNTIEAGAQSAKLSVMDIGDKKAIRRSGLEIKKAEEAEAQKKSQQEKEWEIPAFLRFKK